ncbi:MAG: C1 family peptidase [Lentihominibacter sp.]|jgi:C1A family cysteine protease
MRNRVVAIITALMFLLGTAYVPVNYAVESDTGTTETTETTEAVEATEATETAEAEETTEAEFRDVKVPAWFSPTDIAVKNPNIKTNKTTEPAILEAAEDVVKSPSGIKSTSSSYDARNESWYNGIIKNQYSTGLCWACTTATAAELSYGRETGTKAPGLSPAHLGYFFYNRVSDPLGNTEGDKNKLTSSTERWYTQGGNPIFTYIAMSGWTGMAQDSEKYPINISVPNSTTTYSNSDAYNNRLILEEAKLIEVMVKGDTIDGEPASEERIEADTQNVKNAIMENGAVASSVYLAKSSNGSFKHLKEVITGEGTYKTCNNNETISVNHAVTVIGWDDNFSREYFYHDGSVDYRPEKNGAWLVQNSWGNNHTFNYFWVSYEDKGFALVGKYGNGDAARYVGTYNMQSADTYDCNYQYDGTAGDGAKTLMPNDKVANIYDVPLHIGDSGQTLDAVGFVTQLDGESAFEVEIYKNVSNRQNPESGEKVYYSAVGTDRAGFYTVPVVGEEISLSGGDNYSIVITSASARATYFGIEQSSVRGFATFEAELPEGKSYYSASEGEWQDAAQSGWCARIKGFASNDTLISSVVNADITIAGQHTYTGSEIKPEVQVKVGGVQLEKGRDYSIKFANNINAGNATVTITGIGDFTGTTSKTFRIYPAKITGIELSQESFTYNGRTLRPTVTAAYAGSRAIEGGYNVANSGGKAVGTYTVKVTGTGNYTGTISKNFTIRPRGTTITKLYRKKRAFKVRWKAQKTRMNRYRVTGYRIKYSRYANMSKAGTRSVKGYSRTSKTIYKLKRGATYYVQIQTYMSVKGKTYYSNWSGVKKVRVR